MNAAIILPFSGTRFTDAKSDVGDTEKLPPYEQWIFTNTPSLQKLSYEQKINHISEMRHAIDSFIGYEAKVFEKINELAESDKRVEVAKQQNKPKHIITSLEIELMTLYFELEDLGITTQDRWDASPKYWKNKVIEAKKRIESIDVKSVSEGFDKNSNIHFVHQTDLALKRTSLMTVPIWSVYGVTVPFPVVTWGDGIRALTHQSGMLYLLMAMLHLKIKYAWIVARILKVIRLRHFLDKRVI